MSGSYAIPSPGWRPIFEEQCRRLQIQIWGYRALWRPFPKIATGFMLNILTQVAQRNKFAQDSWLEPMEKLDTLGNNISSHGVSSLSRLPSKYELSNLSFDWADLVQNTLWRGLGRIELENQFANPTNSSIISSLGPWLHPATSLRPFLSHQLSIFMQP